MRELIILREDTTDFYPLFILSSSLGFYLLPFFNFDFIQIIVSHKLPFYLLFIHFGYSMGAIETDLVVFLALCDLLLHLTNYCYIQSYCQ